jgi:hypothetical protein
MQQQQNELPAFQERKLQLALQAIEPDATLSQRRAAKIYNVPRSTLSTRRAGKMLLCGCTPKSTKLFKTEEDVNRTPTFQSWQKVDFHRFFAFVHLKCLPELDSQRLFPADDVAGVKSITNSNIGPPPTTCFTALPSSKSHQHSSQDT